MNGALHKQNNIYTNSAISPIIIIYAYIILIYNGKLVQLKAFIIYSTVWVVLYWLLFPNNRPASSIIHKNVFISRVHAPFTQQLDGFLQIVVLFEETESNAHFHCWFMVGIKENRWRYAHYPNIFRQPFGKSEIFQFVRFGA